MSSPSRPIFLYKKGQVPTCTKGQVDSYGSMDCVVAHRLSTIRGAHKIMAVNGGQIEEIGPHDELMAKKGFYYNLYMSQFKGKLPGSGEVDHSQFAST